MLASQAATQAPLSGEYSHGDTTCACKSLAARAVASRSQNTSFSISDSARAAFVSDRGAALLGGRFDRIQQVVTEHMNDRTGRRLYRECGATSTTASEGTMPFEIRPADEVPNDSVATYPFGDMQVGEAFVVPADHPGAQPMGGKQGASARVTAAASQHSRRYGVKLRTNRQRDGSVRVERIA